MRSLQPQSQVSIDGLTPRQAIELIGCMRKGHRKTVSKRADYLIKEFNLEQWADKIARDLSGGIKRLVIFCMTAVIPGQLVIFDEPTNDIDPVRRRLLWKQIRNLADDGAAVLIVTHNVLESEQKQDLTGNFRLQLVLQPMESVPYCLEYVHMTTHTGPRVLTSVAEKFVSQAVE
ncbi:AAA family ATPase [Gracilibacillus sp. S3-1-1]|uniref:AAA family ATPase n=1 Tax=Gracilibacillus pellucidus TaxID=3095368 RepID=A0ACC6M3M7_9BACI|nr:AAA family ATPase [Gracilibacillus sp. S3-1-1]MDX8045565.1 AAA family ATPase [Gracilibacillus sp. S3-1-1]